MVVYVHLFSSAWWSLRDNLQQQWWKYLSEEAATEVFAGHCNSPVGIYSKDIFVWERLLSTTSLWCNWSPSKFGFTYHRPLEEKLVNCIISTASITLSPLSTMVTLFRKPACGKVYLFCSWDKRTLGTMNCQCCNFWTAIWKRHERLFRNVSDGSRKFCMAPSPCTSGKTKSIYWKSGDVRFV